MFFHIVTSDPRDLSSDLTRLGVVQGGLGCGPGARARWRDDRGEGVISAAIAVLIMVTISAIFFMLTDQALGYLVALLLGIGR